MCMFSVDELRKNLHCVLGVDNYYFMGSFALSKLINQNIENNNIDIVVKDLETKNLAVLEVVRFVEESRSKICEYSVAGSDGLSYYRVTLENKDKKIMVSIFISEEIIEDFTATVLDRVSSYGYRYAGLELYAAWCVKILNYGDRECILDRVSTFIDFYLIDSYVACRGYFCYNSFKNYIERLGADTPDVRRGLEEVLKNYSYFLSWLDFTVMKEYGISDDAHQIISRVRMILENGYELD